MVLGLSGEQPLLGKSLNLQNPCSRPVLQVQHLGFTWSVDRNDIQVVVPFYRGNGLSTQFPDDHRYRRLMADDEHGLAFVLGEDLAYQPFHVVNRRHPGMQGGVDQFLGAGFPGGSQARIIPGAGFCMPEH